MIAAKLAKTHQELLDAINAGVVVRYQPYRGLFGGDYFYRRDNHKNCTAAARALLEKGLVARSDQDVRGAFSLIAKQVTP